MIEKFVIGLAWTSTAAIAFLSLGWWVTFAHSREFEERLEAPDAPGGTPPPAGTVDLRGSFRKFDGTPSSLPGAWPRFRGPSFDNIGDQRVRLADSWSGKGPPVLWSVDLGEGHAGPAVRNGCVYLLDYDEQEGGDALRCFSLDDGREIWKRWYRVKIKRNHGRSRTVPAVTDRYVVTMGPACHVLCARSDSGEFLWGLDLPVEFGTKVPLWYTGQCPLIDGSTAVLAPGGRALMVGVDCESGRIVWETPNPRGWRMSHSSIIPQTIHGRRMYVYCAAGAMVFVAADGEERGSLLFETTMWNHRVIAPSPVPLDDDRILVTAGYGAGSRILRVVEEGGRFSVRTLSILDKSVFACEQQTPVFHRNLLFTILPNDAGPTKRQAACMHSDGKIAWTSGPDKRFGLGPFLVADDKMFILRDDGVLTMIKASGEAYEELARAKVLSGRDAWGPMALVNSRLLLRDSKRMVCLDVSP